MKREPLPSTLHQSGWNATNEETLAAAATSLYLKVSNGEETQSGRTPDEATYLLEVLQENPNKATEVENLSQENLLARKLSLWAEQGEKAEAATKLGEAALEAECRFLLERDLVEIELHRRKA